MADNPNMRIYDAVRFVPEQAKKKILGGRLKGMTDINPMWRIKKLTEQFGPCGVGWYPSDVRYWKDSLDKNGTVALSCDLYLHVKIDGEWQKPIYGIGGSMLVAAESGGLRLNDEAYKSAYTDAISVACKALGIGADVYFEKDVTKYSEYEGESEQKDKQQPAQQHAQQPAAVQFDYRAAAAQYRKARNITADQFAVLRDACIRSGEVTDMRSVDMAQRDWEALFRAIDERLGWAS